MTLRSTPRLTLRVTRTFLAAGIGAGLLVAAPVLASSRSVAYAADAPGRSGDPVATARWLHGQLYAPGNADGGVAGGMPSPYVAGDSDWGLTIDTYWALKAAGLSGAELAPTWNAIESKADVFAGPYPGTTDLLGGASAKVLLAAETAGADPTKITVSDGTVYDFRRRTLDLITASGTDKGRIKDQSASGYDSNNMFGQSLTVLGLIGAGSLNATDRATLQGAVDFMRAQQCDKGFFRIAFDDGGSCDAASPAADPDNDATAMGLQALLAAREAGLDVPQSSIDAAAKILMTRQQADGSFGGGVGTEDPNTNSTGLVAAALEATGCTTAATEAGTWVATLEVGAAQAGGPVAKEAGAIAKDRDSFEGAVQSGIDDFARDTWRRASAQAEFALVRVPFIDLVDGFTPPATSPTCPTTTPTTPPPTTTTPPPTTASPAPTAATSTSPSASASSTLPTSTVTASKTSAAVGSTPAAAAGGAMRRSGAFDDAPYAASGSTASDSLTSATESTTAAPPTTTDSAIDTATATPSDTSSSTTVVSSTPAPNVVAAQPLGDTSSGLPAYVWAILGGIGLGVVFLAVSALRSGRT